MKALSVRQPYAELIARGEKRIEYRSWSTPHRGPLLIVASSRPDPEGLDVEGFKAGALPCGVAICVVDVVKMTGGAGDYRWHLRDPRRVEPAPIKGALHLFDVADGLVLPVAPGPVVPRFRPPLRKAGPGYGLRADDLGTTYGLRAEQALELARRHVAKGPGRWAEVLDCYGGPMAIMRSPPAPPEPGARRGRPAASLRWRSGARMTARR